MSVYTKNVSEPWFTLIHLGLKKVEGRLNKGDFAKMKKDDIVVFTNDSLGFKRTTTVVIEDIKEYKYFRTYLIHQGIDRCLPGIETIDDGQQVYYNYFSKAEEKKYGVLAIIW